ncbi:membrane protein insertion efficiency factor YidD [Corallococcus interemptor]|uniref:membrane protein insertion efficiency factor YidD n=1 Tax=Corallococcus TaxID=83461 RepID=UPI001CBBE527|nr:MULTISPECIES: membrane protein insertion efficiency factor YidD [unclassified Corallococcus]MBZ4335859.1 membrane protein insertion efficiency factor YidD [Corallococcus sp. AS-1-12]MBZ4376748.1 membrane protein insertion efficiency factor YidD [Corallococcus sp. AS-1-6]
MNPGPPPWEGNPYSALALFPEASRELQAAPAPRPTRLPWWLDPLCLVAVALILLYRHAVPHRWKRQCIYTPTCSLYGLQSLQKYGLWRGGLHTWARIRRCNDVLFLGGTDLP